jgi:hypothetical protein
MESYVCNNNFKIVKLALHERKKRLFPDCATERLLLFATSVAVFKLLESEMNVDKALYVRVLVKAIKMHNFPMLDYLIASGIKIRLADAVRSEYMLRSVLSVNYVDDIVDGHYKEFYDRLQLCVIDYNIDIMLHHAIYNDRKPAYCYLLSIGATLTMEQIIQTSNMPHVILLCHEYGLITDIDRFIKIYDVRHLNTSIVEIIKHFIPYMSIKLRLYMMRKLLSVDDHGLLELLYNKK